MHFDHAEPTEGPADTSCTACSQPITDSYYEVNGHVTCPRCRTQVVAQLNAGSSAGRFARATALGLLAAGAGFGIYYAIAKLTGMEFSIIAIVVGVMVGAAVKRGSNGRGGWRYQLLAVFLTYTAIVSTYVPFVIEGLREGSQTATDSAAVRDSAPGALRRSGDTVTIAAAAPADSAATVTAGQAAVGLMMLTGLFLALPFLAGFENIMGLVIIAIGLYAAWSTAGRTALKITGPYRLGAAATP